MRARPILIILLFISSCNKSEQIQEDISTVPRLLTFEEIAQIGKSHNYFLDEIFNDFDWTSEDFLDELNVQIKSTAVAHNLDFDVQGNIRYYSTCNFECLINNYAKQERDIVQKARGILSATSTLDEISKNLEMLKAEARSTLTDPLELNRTLVTLEILKNSAEFWLPKAKGGNGKGDLIIRKIRSKNLEKKLSPCLSAVIAADGVAAGSDMIISAFYLAITGGPVTAGAFFGLVGISAAVSSAWAALQNCTNNEEESPE